MCVERYVIRFSDLFAMSPPPSDFMLPFYELFEQLWEDGRVYNYQQAQVYFHIIIIGGFILGGLLLLTAIVALVSCTTTCGHRITLMRGIHAILTILLTTTIAALIATGVGASDASPTPQFIITLISLIAIAGVATYSYIASHDWCFGPQSRARTAKARAAKERMTAIPLKQYDATTGAIRKRVNSEDNDENFIMLISDDPFTPAESSYVSPLLSRVGASTITIAVLTILVYSVFFNGICVSFMPMHWSSSLTRLTEPRICGHDNICHIYFTTTPYPDVSMRVHFHTTYKLTHPIVRYSSEGPGLANATHTTASHIVPIVKKLDNPYTDRWVYTIVIEYLQPNTTYFVYAGDVDQTGKERKIRTFPASGTPNDYRFVAGGDIGTTESANALLANAATKEPLFFLAGGDLAYANSICACYYVWDQFLHNLDTLFVTPTGYSIPIFSVIGNHDVGGYERSREDVKFYYDYFPSATQQSYRSMSFANTSVIGIDSDFQVRLAGTQKEWTVSELGHSVGRASFVAYHLPLFPTMKSYYNADRVVAMRDSYVPYFYENGVDIAFEFHRHGYKRTKSLNGTVYIGDGCMGATESWDTHEDLPYLVKASSTSHYLLITVGSSQIRSDAINVDGAIFDSVEM